MVSYNRLLSPSIMFSRFIPITAWRNTSFLFDIALYGYAAFCLPIISGWTFGLFPPFGHREWYCHKHLHTSFHVNTFSFIYLFLVCFLESHPRHMEAPRPGAESELQLPAYTTAIAMLDPSCVCHRHHSSPQRRIHNSLREARDRAHVLMDTSQVHYRWATRGPLDTGFHFSWGWT